MTTQQRIEKLFDLYIYCLKIYRNICNKDSAIGRENLEYRYHCPRYVFEQMTVHMSELLSTLEAIGYCNNWDFEKEAAKRIGAEEADKLIKADTEAKAEETIKDTNEEQTLVTEEISASVSKEYLEMQDTINKGVKTLLDMGIDATELYDEMNAIGTSEERIKFLRNKYSEMKSK